MCAFLMETMAITKASGTGIHITVNFNTENYQGKETAHQGNYLQRRESFITFNKFEIHMSNVRL